MHSSQLQKDHFDAIAGSYYDATQHPVCLEFNRRLWGRVLRRHPHVLPRGASVLEPMCGHGVAKGYLERFVHGDFTCSGFDVSPAMVAIAKRRMPDADIRVLDITAFDAAGQYDLIFLSGGLHHVYRDAADVLARLRRALKPGGFLLSGEPTYANPVYRRLGERLYRHHGAFEPESEQRFALSRLNQLYRGAGFSIEDQIYPGLMAYCMAISALCFPKFCVGTPALIRGLMRLEAPFYGTAPARILSFSTVTLLKA
jgi:SAM-dependent methyltransferase